MKIFDRIFDAPIEAADRILKIPAEKAVPGEPLYDKYAAGIHWMEASGFLFVGGIAAALAGVEAGGPAAVLSFGLAYAGLIKTVQNAGRLTDDNEAL